MAKEPYIVNAFLKEDSVISILSLQRGKRTMCRELHATNIGGIEVGTMRGCKTEIMQYPKEKIQLVRCYDVLK